MFGNFIHPGHILLYPVRRRSWIGMKYGVIDEIKYDDNKNYHGKIYTLSKKYDKKFNKLILYLSVRKFISFERSIIIPLSYFHNKKYGHDLICSKALEILKNGKY
jgi:hypothetical protein